MDKSQSTFYTSREFPYSPAQIYEAFSNAELLAKWWGPEGFQNTFQHFEFTIDGCWRFIMHSPDGKDYPNENRFLVLDPNRKIVIRHDCLPYFTLTVDFVEREKSTEIRWAQSFDDATTAQSIKQIVVPANEQNLDRLGHILDIANKT